MKIIKIAIAETDIEKLKNHLSKANFDLQILENDYLDTALLSEESLSKDWLSDEDDVWDKIYKKQ